MSVAKAWGSSVHSCSVFLRFFTHIFSHNPSLPINHHSCPAGCRQFPAASCRFFPCVTSPMRLCSASMPDPNSRYCWSPWLPLLSPPPSHQHALPPPLTHKDISCRGNLAPPPPPLSQACFSLSWVAMFVTSYVWGFFKSHVILFTWCFSFILDQSKRKRLPFSGIIPYAQTPKGSHLFLNFTNCFYQLLFVRLRMRTRVYHLSPFVWTCRVLGELIMGHIVASD